MSHDRISRESVISSPEISPNFNVEHRNRMRVNTPRMERRVSNPRENGRRIKSVPDKRKKLAGKRIHRGGPRIDRGKYAYRYPP